MNKKRFRQILMIGTTAVSALSEYGHLLPSWANLGLAWVGGALKLVPRIFGEPDAARAVK